MKFWKCHRCGKGFEAYEAGGALVGPLCQTCNEVDPERLAKVESARLLQEAIERVLAVWKSPDATEYMRSLASRCPEAVCLIVEDYFRLKGIEVPG